VNPRARRGVARLAVLGLTASLACASPIGVERMDPRAVHRYLTANALSAERASDFSRNTLRRYGLLDAYENDPAAALATLHEKGFAEEDPSEALFALAELSFLHAEREKSRAHFTATVVYAYALLFPEERTVALEPLDPRLRIAADLYNRALTSAFLRDEGGRLLSDRQSTEIALPFAIVRARVKPDALRWGDQELVDLIPTAEISVRGLRNRYRRAGIGAPLAAHAKPLREDPNPALAVAPIIRVPVTAVFRIAEPLRQIRAGAIDGELDLFPSWETESVELGGRLVPLESEPTAALAQTLSESRFWELEKGIFLGRAVAARNPHGLAAIAPFAPERIPVVFVHGTASSPARWADMLNDLSNDARVRDRFQFWFFAYDSGNPIAYSANQLRRSLVQAVDGLDPAGANACLRSMVVMGHSQGGLLTKLMVVDSGDRFWANASKKPFDEVKLPPETQDLLRSSLFVKPLPFVTRVVFLSTPHRGSYLAGPQIVRRLAQRLVRLPGDVARAGLDLSQLASSDTSMLSLQRVPTSIDNMSPGHPFIRTLASIPVTPGVHAHSIISVKEGFDPIESGNDGVVKYASAHVDGVESEKVIRSPHSLQANPGTIEEVRRILLEHSAGAACPLAAAP
jgi:triacylglycerol esterase/lipase EstA (alpha/beta hydrolase family)